MKNPERSGPVLVTGASRGLGLEIALDLAGRGVEVWAGYRDAAGRERIEREAAQRAVTVNPVELDVTDEASVDRAVTRIESAPEYRGSAGPSDRAAASIESVPEAGGGAGPADRAAASIESAPGSTGGAESANAEAARIKSAPGSGGGNGAEGRALAGVVCNAGVMLRGYFEDLEDREIRRLFEVNLFGTMCVVRRVLPAMRRAGEGRVVLMSSIAGRIGAAALTSYTASKFALEGFGESLYQEVAPFGVHVGLVEPGIVATDIWEAKGADAERAADPASPYHRAFRELDRQSEALVRSSKTTTADVARAVHRALTDERPRLRYMVGRRAKLVAGLRRYVPGEIFDRLYFGAIMRRLSDS